MRRIMLVDDEIHVLQSLQRSLREIAQEEQLVIETQSSPLDAIKRLGEAQFHVIISDNHMPEMNGIDFLKLVGAMQPAAIRLMLSASAEFKTVMGAVNEAEVFRYIEKPWNIEGLKETIKDALVQYSRNQAKQDLVDEAKMRKNEITPEELEKQRLENEEPGITHVKRSADGSILID